jgi:hypothetical protein
MADRYWVGGSGNWNATSTTNWAASSGGASGASAPTSADNVIFDTNSNTLLLPFTVTVTGTTAAPALCADFSTSALDGAMTLTMGATAFLDVYGSMTLPVTNFSVSATVGAGIRYKSTTTGKTVTTNGVSLSNARVSFIGNGGAWTLGSALTTLREMDVNEGTFDTGNFNVSCLSFNTSTIAVVKSINLGSSTLTVSGATPAFSIGTPTNLTWNAGTSTIICSSSSPTFNGAGFTFYNVSFTSNAASAITITGANTYNDLTFTSRASTGIAFITINANQTVSGTLTLGAANTVIRRLFIRSDVVGTARTITAATVATLADVDFRDIVGAGVGTWTGTRLGNCGGNSGITLDAAKTVYRVGTGNWSATQWSLTSGGAVDVNNFPLAQDTAIFDTGTTTGTHSIDASWNIGNLDMSALNVAVTLSSGSLATIYGNLTLDANVTFTGTSNSINFSGVSNQTITSAGITFTQPLVLNKPTTTSLILGDALTSNLGFTLTQGTLNLNNFDLTCLTFSSSNTNTRAIAFGTGKIVITGNNALIFTMVPTTNFSCTGTKNIEFNYSGSTGDRTFAFQPTATPESNLLNFIVKPAGDNVYVNRNQAEFFGANNITIESGFTGNFGVSLASANTLRIYGNLSIPSTLNGFGPTAGISFLSDSNVQTLTTSGKTMDFPVTKSGAGTLQLQDNLTIGSTRTFTLTAGTLDLTGNSGNWTVSTGLFVSSNSNTRSIAFGTGKINITGNNATVLSTETATNFSYTGTSNITLSYSGSIGVRAIAPPGSTTGGTEANTMNINVTAGSDTINISSTRTVKNFDFTGFTGTFTLTGAAWVYGNLTLSTGMSVGASAFVLSFKATSGTQLITSNGKTIDNLVTFDGVGGTFRLEDDLTLGSTRTCTLTNGTLNINSKTLTTGLFSSSNSNTRVVAYGTNGNIVVNGGNWTATTATNLSYTGTGTISMTYSLAKTFAGGGSSYPILNQGGAGALSITGANTFTNITNTVQPATVTFPASTTTTVSNFSLLGTVGNLITLNSSTAGTRANLSDASGTVSRDYLSIQDINATGGASWYAGDNSTNVSNNIGWIFTAVPIVSKGNFFFMMGM